MCIFAGYQRAGIWGGVLAGIGFMLPAFAIMLVFVSMHSAYGALPFMRDALWHQPRSAGHFHRRRLAPWMQRDQGPGFSNSSGCHLPWRSPPGPAGIFLLPDASASRCITHAEWAITAALAVASPRRRAFLRSRFFRRLPGSAASAGPPGYWCVFLQGRGADVRRRSDHHRFHPGSGREPAALDHGGAVPRCVGDRPGDTGARDHACGFRRLQGRRIWPVRQSRQPRSSCRHSFMFSVLPMLDHVRSLAWMRAAMRGNQSRGCRRNRPDGAAVDAVRRSRRVYGSASSSPAGLLRRLPAPLMAVAGGVLEFCAPALRDALT